MTVSSTMRSGVLFAVVLLIAAVALFAARAEAVDSLFFVEPFDSATDVAHNLEDLDGAFTLSGGSTTTIGKTVGLGGEERSYVRTIRSDYFSSDWVYTIDVNLVGFDIVFIGVGEGVPNAPGSGPTYNEPADAVFFRMHTGSFGGGGIHVAVMEAGGGWTSFPPGLPPISPLADGPYTVRIEKLGSDLEFSVDGVPGVFPVSIPTSATFLDDTNSRLFFGSSGGPGGPVPFGVPDGPPYVSFDNMVVGPHPDSTPPAPTLPTTKAECKRGGWEGYGVFKNQGDCVSFVATKGKNPPSG